MRHKLVVTLKDSDEHVGFLGLLTIAFIVLKITGFISWSWLWVLSPLWLPIAVALAVFFIVGAGALIWAVYKHHADERLRRRNMSHLQN